MVVSIKQGVRDGSRPPNFREDLRISDQNNWGEPEQKIIFFFLGGGGGGGA